MSVPWLRPADSTSLRDQAERAGIIARTRTQRAEIEQIFLDCAHWNDSVRKPEEKPIDPDPDGRLRRIADHIDRILAEEDAKGTRQ